MVKSMVRGLLVLAATVGSMVSANDSIVEFHIKPNTGKNAWNTRDSLVEVKVGQTLRIFNDDSVAHYLHTPGEPCPHGANPFKGGEFYDCVVTKVADPDNTILYDHQFGAKARFYVRATN